MSRISSLDAGYVSGQLSVYPEALDDKTTLYEVANNATTVLKQSLAFNGKNIVVEDASAFPTQGLLRIGPKEGVSGNAELIYYGKRTDTVFSQLVRAFAGSTQSVWYANDTYVTNAVMAEHHNAIKDAVLNIENHIGTKENPTANSINGLLKTLENTHLAPKPLFRAFPLRGAPSLTVKFQNLSSANAIRFFWDFGDGTSSVLRSPTHVYQNEGIYTVKLNIITTTGAQGVATKKNYVVVNENEQIPFFYTVVDESDSMTYHFVDQTDGNIVSRSWIFDDGTTETQSDPDIHTTSHTYTSTGTYNPTLIVVFADQSFKRVFLREELIVT